MAEVRKVETDAPEGAGPEHTAYEYQLGAEIDGVWVPFVTKSGGYIDHLVAAGKSTQTDTSSSSTESNTQTGSPGFGNTTAGGEQPNQQAEPTPAGEGGTA